MKSTLFLALLGLLFFGCNQNNPQPQPSSQGSTMQWNATIDGQTYSWSSTFTPGQYPTNSSNDASSTALNEPINTPLSFLGVKNDPNDQKAMMISLPTFTTGTYTCSSANYANNNYVGFSLNGNPNYSTAWGGSVTVNVTSCPTAIYNAVICTFSGTIGRSPSLGGGTVSISGSFDAVKMN